MRLFLSLVILLANQFPAWSQAPSTRPRRVSAVVTKLVGPTESGDALIFKTNKGEFYVYVANDFGEAHLELIKKSLKTKKPICLVLDPDLKGFVTEVLPQCKGK